MKQTLLFFLLPFIGVTPGHAQLINGSIIVSEINYNSDSSTNSGDWFELYNTSATAADISGWVVRDQSIANQYTIPSGTSVPGNGFLVVVNNTPFFTTRYPGITNFVGMFSFGLTNSGDQIRLFNNVGELQYTVTYQDTLDWPEGADGKGRTLELVNETADPNLSASWFDGCMFGSPGTAYQVCDPQIVFSEINYNSDTLNDSDDWIELYNRSGASMILTNWRLKDSRDSNVFVFPTLTMPANSYLVVCNDEAKFSAVHPTVTNKIGDLGFSISNGGEAMRLFNAQNVLQFSVVFNDTMPWPETPDGDGYTLELLDATGHMNDAANWFAGCFLGSPGTAYNPACPLSISETDALNDVVVYPNIDFTAFDVLIPTDVNGDVVFTLFDLQGRRIKTGLLHQGVNSISISGLNTGVYFIQLQQASEAKAFKLPVYR